MNLPIIFLTGLPGVGKTFWGKRWASGYKWTFIGLDKAIGESAHKGIAEIFQEIGEAGFRKLETAILKKVLSNHSTPILIAAGGGVICSAENRDILKKGCTVWLKDSVDSIATRLKHEAEKRPLLSGDITRALKELLTQREYLYKEADTHIEISAIDENTFQIITQQCIKKP